MQPNMQMAIPDDIQGYPNWEVYIEGEKLDPAESLKLHKHSLDGFAWGYGGAGPAQLALALLLHFTDEKFALKHYQKFKSEVINNLIYGEAFNIPIEFIQSWIKYEQLREEAEA